MPNIDITKPELIWPGKYDAEGNRVIDRGVALPFQVVETIREGRASREKGFIRDLLSAKPSTQEEWHNKLIWEENLLVMASLAEEFAGMVDLIYIDPPFATGLDFSVRTICGEESGEVVKNQSIIEEKAYRNTWGRGYDSYIQMMYARLSYCKDLLSSDGSIYVHLGPQVNQFIRLITKEIFGASSTSRELVWKRVSARGHGRFYPATHDLILYFTKSQTPTWNQQYEALDENYVQTKYRFKDENGRIYRKDNCTNQNKNRPNLTYEWNGHIKTWRWTREKMQALHDAGRLIYTKNGVPEFKRYLNESEGVPLQSVWADINPINSQAIEDTGYDTQKPESLLERIVQTSSDEGDIVADFFCGSGTTLAVAEKLNRRWIGCDLGRFAIHTTRKRLLGIPDCKPFEILNLGRYERKHWQGVTFGGEKPADPDQAEVAAYVRFILDLYHAQPLPGSHIHGRKGAALVHVGAVDAPMTISQIGKALAETEALGQKELHILGWEWEMGLHDRIVQQARQTHGVRLRLLNIPREVMERQAVDRGNVRFFDLAYLQAEVIAVPPAQGGTTTDSRRVKVRLTDFAIPDTDLIPEEVRSKVQKWSDYIDYWAVDGDFQHDTFMNQWQAYRTRKVRKLDLVSAEHNYHKPGQHQVLVKVVDIFGNDTSRLLSWDVR